MLKKILVLGTWCLVLGMGIYLILPIPDFPPPPPGSLQSLEPADTESIYRKSYFTNMSRPEIMAMYDKSYSSPVQYRMDLPPESAYTVIRDQTRSSYLEEIIHPFRDSLYINVFVPIKPYSLFKQNYSPSNSFPADDQNYGHAPCWNCGLFNYQRIPTCLK